MSEKSLPKKKIENKAHRINENTNAPKVATQKRGRMDDNTKELLEICERRDLTPNDVQKILKKKTVSCVERYFTGKKRIPDNDLYTLKKWDKAQKKKEPPKSPKKIKNSSAEKKDGVNAKEMIQALQAEIPPLVPSSKNGGKKQTSRKGDSHVKT